MHDAAQAAVGQMIRESQCDATAPMTGIDLGGADYNGTARWQFPQTTWTSVDIRPNRGVDVVADAASYRPDEPVDVVLCTELLEHAQNWRACVLNAIRILKPGGYLFITCAGDGRGEHSHSGNPLPAEEYYGNVELSELRKVLKASPGLSDTNWGLRYAPVVCDLYAWARKPVGS
jgi:SAM-dependent methyltransferase